MVKVNISTAGKPPSFARKWPITVELSGKTVETATVEDVKKAIAKQYPKVSNCHKYFGVDFC